MEVFIYMYTRIYIWVKANNKTVLVKDFATTALSHITELKIYSRVEILL